jgi:hypothetical protein
MVDGAGSSGSAAIKSPYPGDSRKYGILNISEQEFNDRIENAHRAGCQIALCASGIRLLKWLWTVIPRHFLLTLDGILTGKKVPKEIWPGCAIVSRVPSVELEKNTLKNYEFIFIRFQEAFGDRQIDSITSEDVFSFLTGLSTSSKPATKRHRHSSLKALFNFLKNSVDSNIQNPCDTAMLRKMFHEPTFAANGV